MSAFWTGGANLRVPKLPAYEALLRQPDVTSDAPYYGMDWVRDVAGRIKANLPLVETPTCRKSPFAVVRMARGGKTRALYELARELRGRGVKTVLISFNDASVFLDSEKGSLEDALWRRVSFELCDRSIPFHECAAAEGVREWIEACPRGFSIAGG